MMSLQMLTRPERDLYVNNPPETYEEPYYTSTWNSAGGRLPIIYKLLSDKFPVNSYDDVNTITTVSNYNGYAQLNLPGTYETYVALEYIKVEGASVSQYNGVWQVIDVPNATQIVINCVYSGTATGTLQRYYKNYQANIKVYCGLPASHALVSSDPMEEIATLKVSPNSDNVCIVDVSAFLKEKFSLDFNTDANDLNKWTAFYIKYAESYDVSDGTEVTSYTSEYTIDTYDGCGGEKITNGAFTGNINGWSNVGIGSNWGYGSNDARTAKGSNTKSSRLIQDLTLRQGVVYHLSFNAYNNDVPYVINYRVLLTYSFGTVEVYSNSISASSQSNSLYFTAIENECSIEFEVISFSPGRSTQYFGIDTVSVMPSDCTAYLYGINGVRQFQSRYGGNFGEYVMNFNGQVYDSKFLTLFDNITLFDGQYLDVSCIIPSSQFDISKDNKLYCKVDLYNKDTYISSTDKEIESLSDGVYRIKLSDVEYAGGDRFKIRLYRLPYNIFIDGDSGNFDYTSDPSGTPPSDWDVIAPNASYTTTESKSGIGSANIQLGSGVSGKPAGDINRSLYNNTTISVQPNMIYKISSYILFGAVDISSNNYKNRSHVSLLPVGYTVNDCISVDRYEINSANEADPQWLLIETIFNSGNNTSIQVGPCLITDATIPALRTVSYLVDELKLEGPYDWISEEKTVMVDSSCTKQSIHLRWTNPLGGDEYFTFKAVKDYETSIEEVREFTKDPFNNWDDNFVGGQTQDDNLDIEAYWTVTVRAQYLNSDQIKVIGGDRSKGSPGIMGAIRVTDITDVNNPITVRVDKRSIKVRKDNSKLNTIEFDIRYPRIEIQNQ